MLGAKNVIAEMEISAGCVDVCMAEHLSECFEVSAICNILACKKMAECVWVETAMYSGLFG